MVKKVIVFSIIIVVVCFGDWCNGSTIDFGSVRTGSSPVSPTCVHLMFFMLIKILNRRIQVLLSSCFARWAANGL